MVLERAKRELYPIFKALKPEIDKKLSEFKRIGENGSVERIFMEMAFCILTPSSKAENAWSAVLRLNENGLLYRGDLADIVEYLNVVRFKNNKAKNILLARELFLKGNMFAEMFSMFKNNPLELREWLVRRVRGFSYKEATHFLRNIGKSGNLCILDRHILRNLLDFEVVEEIEGSLTKNRYLQIEKKMQDFAGEINIAVEYLDFIFWFRKTGRIFK